MESPGETVVHPPRIDRMGARCKVPGAKWQVPGKIAPFRLTVSRRRTGRLMAMNPVRLRLTVKRNQAYNSASLRAQRSQRPSKA
jgi:hypothetical protein